MSVDSEFTRVTKQHYLPIVSINGQWKTRRGDPREVFESIERDCERIDQTCFVLRSFRMRVGESDVHVLFDYVSGNGPQLFDYEPAVHELMIDTFGGVVSQPMYVVRERSDSEMDLAYITPSSPIQPGAMAAAVVRLSSCWWDLPDTQIVRWYGGVLKVETRYEKDWFARVVDRA